MLAPLEIISSYTGAKGNTEFYPGSMIAWKPWQELYKSGAHGHGVSISSSVGGSLPFMKAA